MSKLSLTDLTNLQNEQTATAALNANSAATETALENTLSRDGTSPNEMESNLDMNSHRIFNLVAAIDDTEPVRLAEFNDLVMPAVVPVSIPVAIGAGGTGATTAVQARSNLGLRDKWTSSRTYYVRTGGSDTISHTGLTNTDGDAFLTIQRAVDVIYASDTQGYTPNIEVASGTYTGSTTLSGKLTGATIQPITITGVGTPIINAPAPFTLNLGAFANISGFDLRSSGTAISVNSNSTLSLALMTFGVCTGFHIVAVDFSNVHISGNWTINGSSGGFCHIVHNSILTTDALSVCALVGNPAFAAFFAGTSENSFMLWLTGFSGTATGVQSFIHQGSIVEAGNSGGTPAHPDDYFPGSVPSTFVGDGSFNDATGLNFFATTSSLTGPSGAPRLINVYGYSPLKTIVTQDNTGMLSCPFPLGGKTVAQLPAASATIKGLRDVVSDCTTQVFMATAIGGGALVAPVTCIGTSWVVA